MMLRVSMLIMILSTGLALAAPATEEVLTRSVPSTATRASIPLNPQQHPRVLTVGTTISPPFVIASSDGRLSGLSISLWRHIAKELGYQTHFKLYPFRPLLAAVSAKQVDAAISSITVSADRATRMDFSEPFFVTGLAIAVPAKREADWKAVLAAAISWHVLDLLFGALVLLTAVGTLMWLIERRHNRTTFGGDEANGIGKGIWWSAQTMTSVGYGDVIPRTTAGRLLAILWMLLGVVTTSGFTASLTTALTINQLQGPVKTANDLQHVRVGTIAGSTSQAYLANRGIRPKLFIGVQPALAALKSGKLDAVVYDEPLLNYAIRRHFAGQERVLPLLLQRQFYAVAIPLDSPFRSQINMALLEFTQSPRWAGLVRRYLGPGGG
ncbi:MAG: transporter substrate-binding domain-containing protein [Phycisphaerales bacterium]|nr:transporter substrate-binding domain-containing protein [Phycisphaerales bacterium]